jgi:hypothetical protein
MKINHAVEDGPVFVMNLKVIPLFKFTNLIDLQIFLNDEC